MPRRVACLMFTAAVTSSAMAAQATIGGVSFSLPPPAGFCELSDANASDHRLLTADGECWPKAVISC